MSSALSRAAVLALLTSAVCGCRIDHGLEPEPRHTSWSGIEGTVYFLGEWPEEVEEVLVKKAPSEKLFGGVEITEDHKHREHFN